jgi:hypothetical protein
MYATFRHVCNIRPVVYGVKVNDVLFYNWQIQLNENAQQVTKTNCTTSCNITRTLTIVLASFMLDTYQTHYFRNRV